MKLARWLLAAAVIGASLVCVRLGVWQWSRWGEKRAANQAQRAALSAPPRDLTGALPPVAELGERPIRLAGRFDPRFQFLIRGEIREGEPGVRVSMPFVRDADSVAVMVDRGWLPAADAATLEAGAIPLDTSSVVVGIAREFTVRGAVPPLRNLGRDTVRLWSAARLDSDTLRARLPFKVAPLVVQALPGFGAPSSPLRDAPRGLDEGMHLGYAFQWFGIAVLIPLVAWFAARARTRAGERGDSRRSP